MWAALLRIGGAAMRGGAARAGAAAAEGAESRLVSQAQKLATSNGNQTQRQPRQTLYTSSGAPASAPVEIPAYRPWGA